MTTRILPAAIAAFALLGLAACGKPQPEEVDNRAPDPMADALKNAAPVELPPSVKASVTFRCQPGNSLVYVDFFDGDKLANLKTGKDASPIKLTAPAAGEPLTGDGYTVKGDAKAIDYTTADGKTLSCKA